MSGRNRYHHNDIKNEGHSEQNYYNGKCRQNTLTFSWGATIFYATRSYITKPINDNDPSIQKENYENGPTVGFLVFHIPETNI